MRTAREMTDGVSIVVPTWNEAPNLDALFARLELAAERLGDFEIVIVDDASPDGTAARARELGASLGLPVAVIERHEASPSLASAVVAGAKAARHAVIAVLDADGSHDPTVVPDLAAPVRTGRADIAVGSRYVAGGSIRDWPFRRRAGSGIASLVARMFTRVRDPLSGFFACRRTLLDGTDCEIEPRGYKILLEVLGRAPWARVVEVPIDFHDREFGRSKAGPRVAVDFAIQCSRLAWARTVRRRSSGPVS